MYSNQRDNPGQSSRIRVKKASLWAFPSPTVSNTRSGSPRKPLPEARVGQYLRRLQCEGEGAPTGNPDAERWAQGQHHA